MTITVEQVDLKPCPFCGGDRARTIHIRDGRKVACICGACSKPCFQGPLDEPSAEERAITAWNTRQAENAIEQRFWSIVDPNGVPSDMWDALDRLARRYRTDSKAEEQIKLLREAWAKRTGTVEVMGEAVPYLKIHFDNKEDMATFDDVLRQALEATNG